jgi:hypothetical protein
MAGDDLIELELMLNRFRRLLGELRRGELTRNSFQPWEVEILLDIQSQNLEGVEGAEILRHYEKAVEKQMEMGPGPPMTLSQFFQMRTTRRPTMRKLPLSTIPTASE